MKSKKANRWCEYFWAILVFSMCVTAVESEAPSKEFLEFLAEFNKVNDDDFEMLFIHALEDAQNVEKLDNVEESQDDEN